MIYVSGFCQMLFFACVVTIGAGDTDCGTGLTLWEDTGAGLNADGATGAAGAAGATDAGLNGDSAVWEDAANGDGWLVGTESDVATGAAAAATRDA